MVEEHLRQVAQVLAVVFFFLAVDLEHGDGAMAVDLVAGGVLEAAFLQMLEHLIAALKELVEFFFSVFFCRWW